MPPKRRARAQAKAGPPPPQPSKAARSREGEEEPEEEDEYVAMDELAQTIPSSTPLPDEDEDEEEEEGAGETGMEDSGPEGEDPDVSGSEAASPPASPKRPQRAAARNARHNLSAWTSTGHGSSSVAGPSSRAPLPSPAKTNKPISGSLKTAAKRSAAQCSSSQLDPVEPAGRKRRGEPAEEDVLVEDGGGQTSPDGLPVYAKRTLTFAAAEQLLLVPDATHEGKDSVCRSIPVYSPNEKGGFTFLIDAAALYKIEDIPVDGYGSWTAGGSRASSRSRYYVQMPNGDLMRVDSTIKHNREPAHWDLKLTQTRYVHPSCARLFRKLTYCVRDREGGVKRWAAVTYQWLTDPFSFTPLPHGNCKGGKKELKPFQRTYPSVLAAMKQQLPMRMPKHVLEDIQGAYGVQSQPVPAMPRNRKQLYNLNREAIKETGTPIDHRKWRKTGPAAGQPPGALEVYLEGEDGVELEDVTYVLEDSSVPGLPDDQLTILQEAADVLLEREENFPESDGDPLLVTVVDQDVAFAVRLDAAEAGWVRCSGRCADFRAFRHLCQHTMAVAQRRGCLAQHLALARSQALAQGGSQGLGPALPPLGLDDQDHQLLPDDHHQLLLAQEEVVVANEEPFPHHHIMHHH